MSGHIVQPVRAQQPAFPELDVQGIQIQLGAGINIAEDTHQHVLMRVRFCFFGTEPALIDEPLDEGVVHADLFKLAVAQAVGPGVADVREVQLALREQQGRDGGAHAGQLGVDVHQLREQGVGGLDFIGQNRAGIALVVAVVQVQHVQHGGGGGDIAACVAPHSVRNHSQMTADVR